MVHAKGLLVPGKPSLGVVRYNNCYFVCDHNVGLTAFLKDPEFYINSIKTRVVNNPEYIHLLRVQVRILYFLMLCVTIIIIIVVVVVVVVVAFRI